MEDAGTSMPPCKRNIYPPSSDPCLCPLPHATECSAPLARFVPCLCPLSLKTPVAVSTCISPAHFSHCAWKHPWGSDPQPRVVGQSPKDASRGLF